MTTNNFQKRLEETHREKVTKVMKDWSDLEERYQDMRQGDPRGAEDFKQRMTRRFQQTVQALEEEGDAEKHQLAAMHQQRVLAHINQRKKEAMTCYTQALNEVPPNVSLRYDFRTQQFHIEFVQLRRSQYYATFSRHTECRNVFKRS